MGGAHDDVGKHVQAYIRVFAVLAILTVVTVAVSRIHFPGAGNILVALAIAVVKASLVAAIFMHLKWERASAIWWTLAICAAFFLALMMLPVLTTQETPPQAQFGTWD